MATRRRTTHGLGSYDHAYDYVERQLEDLLSSEERTKAAATRAWEAVESGSASRAFKAKQTLVDAYARLAKTIENARIADSASAHQLDRLPRHAPFTKAHELTNVFRRVLARAEALRKRLTKAIYGDLAEIRSGLASEHDPKRRPAQRRARRRRVARNY